MLAGHDVSWVEREGWKGVENGRLLALVAERFDVLLTADANMAYQNDLSQFDVSLIVLPTNNLGVLRERAADVVAALDRVASLNARILVTIGEGSDPIIVPTGA